jgi:hypothetical protein
LRRFCVSAPTKRLPWLMPPPCMVMSLIASHLSSF